ncbi:hypothetical protein Mal15_35060 [Stieleria maiorica]|uniref:Uncharacterized protein n=1 Tax=Stieleria maiorica TaxID=2795974 RepID=A0A5B9MDU6_9BACT|nr:hypothetical protein [Stieleria maiorica]QEF99441.1 hypothetical protein Mal15_35060 [Stieleria maiorica]
MKGNENSFPARHQPSGFTILEVLIALTAALLLMLGLTRAYKLMGSRITERQSQLELSSKLRDVALRMRDELSRATCQMKPPASAAGSEGYLVYHEGPFTSSTTVLGSTQTPTPRNTGFFPDTRYGDIDDYLAFTARAEKDSPFVGFIPQGILWAQRFASGQLTPDEISRINHVDATRLVPFYSEYAEIAYWASPRYTRSGDGTLRYDQPNLLSNATTPSTTAPRFRDANGDLLPDRLDLHRRVLLIRPDLNMTIEEMFVSNATMAARAGYSGLSIIAFNPATPFVPDTIPTIPFLTRDAAGEIYIRPLSFGSGAQGNLDFYRPNTAGVNPQLAPDPTVPRMNAPGIWWDPSDANRFNHPSPSWLTGLARMQQVMDLSISRETVTWPSLSAAFPTRTDLFASPPSPTAAPEQVAYRGMPSNVVRANDLGQLTRPENRFGFVRIPEPILSGTSGSTGLESSSMPQLALCPPHDYLHSRFTSTPTPPTGATVSEHVQGPPWPTTFPAQADDPRLDITPTSDIDFLNPYGRFTMTTFLRPEFALVDRMSDAGAGLQEAGERPEIINRGGSDIVATDVVSFDVRIFDPSAPHFVWEGRDRVPGNLGDDDGDGFSPDDTRAAGAPVIEIDELGIAGSDDEVVPIDSHRLDEVLVGNGTRSVQGEFDYGSSGGRSNISRFGIVNRGDFVDLNYVRLAGGPMRGLFHRDIVNGNPLMLENIDAFESPFSGIQLPTVTVGAQTFVPFSDAYQDSGRFLLRRGGSQSVSSFYQPIYDTWTDSYATDAFDQEGINGGSYTREPLSGTGTVSGSYAERRVPQANAAAGPQSANMQIQGVLGLSYRRWTSAHSSVNNGGEFAAQSAGIIQNAPTSTTPFKIEAPIPQPLQALKITIRVDDFSAETIRQQTVIQEF